MSSTQLLIGVDVGGTFTDAVVLDAKDGSVLSAFKLPSTPSDPGAAVISALERISGNLDIRGALVCHGTTVGTNTLIERKGARTALLATRGFADVIELRRQNRPNLYDLAVNISAPLVPSELRFGVDERIDPEGRVVREVADLEPLLAELKGKDIASVAICFLHSYAEPRHEQQVADAIAQNLPDVFVTTSSDVCPEFREFERTSTTVVNAYVGPVVSSYMKRLDERAKEIGVDDLMIVKSNGGLTSPGNAAAYPVHLIESGPAAGLIATAAYAASSGRANVIAFDMGGTTAKAGVVRDYTPKVTSEFQADRLVGGRDVGGYPIRSSVLDIVEIGAGGGSIAWIDEGGVLRVGPESAGADPGPACYSRGGTFPTVSDAHAVIGTLSPETFQGSGVSFSRDKAVEVIERELARPLGWPVARAAHAIIDIAVAHMAEMVRLATVRRGLDPREFAILASGGAGPLHASRVGAEVGAREVIIPPLPGMFSALGAVLGKIRHDLSRTMLVQLAGACPDQLQKGFEELKDKADALLEREPGAQAPVTYERFADLRFAGQLFELAVDLGAYEEALPDIDEIERRFRAAYEAEFGFDLKQAAVQLVNLRLVAVRSFGASAQRVLDGAEATAGELQPHRRGIYLDADGSGRSLPVYAGSQGVESSITGPALVEHSGSTVWVGVGQMALLGGDGSVSIRNGNEG